MLWVGDHTARVVCSSGAHIPSASSAPCALTKMRRACLGCRLTSATRVAMWIFIARLCKTLVDDRASDMASSDTCARGAVSMRAVRESLAPKLSGRRCRRRAVPPGSPRPSELLRAFFVAGLCFMLAAALAAIAYELSGRDWLHWLALHLLFLGGISQLVLGAGQFFVCAFLPPTRRPGGSCEHSSRPGTSARCSSRSASQPISRASSRPAAR